MIILEIKPLSVNEANGVNKKGHIVKTAKFHKYCRDLGYILPMMKVPEGKLKLSIIWGFSNEASDNDNPVKIFQDCLQKKYGFNDKMIYKHDIEKEIVKKGKEFIRFKLEAWVNKPL